MQFSPGHSVVYGLHGRCSIEGIEEKQVGGQTVCFYRLQIAHPLLARSPQRSQAKKNNSSIWIPVDTAVKQGLRSVIQADEVEALFEILGDGEYYFSLEENWHSVKQKLEKEIFNHGATGSAKVLSYLHVRSDSHMIPPAEILKFAETVRKPLVREIAEVLDQPISNIEKRVDTALKNKLRPDH